MYQHTAIQVDARRTARIPTEVELVQAIGKNRPRMERLEVRYFFAAQAPLPVAAPAPSLFAPAATFAPLEGTVPIAAAAAPLPAAPAPQLAASVLQGPTTDVLLGDQPRTDIVALS